MARYRIDADPLSQTGFAADDAAYLLTVMLALFIGIALVIISKRGRQICLLTWSAGLVVASVAYLAWVVMR